MRCGGTLFSLFSLENNREIFFLYTHDAYKNTWKCGELKLFFSISDGG